MGQLCEIVYKYDPDFQVSIVIDNYEPFGILSCTRLSVTIIIYKEIILSNKSKLNTINLSVQHFRSLNCNNITPSLQVENFFPTKVLIFLKSFFDL